MVAAARGSAFLDTAVKSTAVGLGQRFHLRPKRCAYVPLKVTTRAATGFPFIAFPDSWSNACTWHHTLAAMSLGRWCLEWFEYPNVRSIHSGSVPSTQTSPSISHLEDIYSPKGIVPANDFARLPCAWTTHTGIDATQCSSTVGSARHRAPLTLRLPRMMERRNRRCSF